MNHRDKQILCGLFLSKFDRQALTYLGFEAFTEAFNAIGYGLRARPASIKNYRDELDPVFPNKRKGWHKRPLREHCQRILDEFRDSDLDRIGRLVKSFLDPSSQAELLPGVAEALKTHNVDPDSSFAKRLITGRAAEQYFASHFSKMEEFRGCRLIETTTWGCGFDFKLDKGSESQFKAVEVKGLRARSGAIMMTNLEYEVAQGLTNAYYLVVVRNFVERPFTTVIRNPLNGSILLERIEQKEVRVSWNAKIA